MKRPILSLCLMCVAALACMSQPRFTSNTERHSLGQIVWKHPVNVQYTVTNTGDRPLVLTSVEPDCACTVAQWTQAPIPPGQKGEINVTFDAEALGHFQKSIAILTNAEPHLVYLYFDGEVVQTLSDFTRSHPYLIGNIRIDRNTLEFPDAHIGDHPTLKLDIVNLSDQAYEPVLMHLPPYIGMEANPTANAKRPNCFILFMVIAVNHKKLLLLFHEYVSTQWLDGQFQFSIRLDWLFFQQRLQFLSVNVEGNRLTGQHGQVHFQLKWVFHGIDGGHIPSGSMPTCQYDVFTWITVNETGFVPCGGHLLHEVHADLRRIGQVIGSQGKVLNRILEKDRRGQLEDIGCTSDGSAIISSVQTFVEERSAKLHTAHRIADKRMQAGVESLVIAKVLLENQVFRS